MASNLIYYWDACLFYEVLGDEPVALEKKEAINEVLQDNKDGKNVIFTSVLTHLEVLPSKLEQKKAGAESQYLSLFDGKKFLDVEINRNILMRAREIREFYYRPAVEGASAKIMDAADAVHLATASVFRVEAFHTRDDDEKGTKIPLVSLYKWSGQDKLCGKYELKIVSPEHAQKALDLIHPALSPAVSADDEQGGLSDAEIEDILAQIEDEAEHTEEKAVPMPSLPDEVANSDDAKPKAEENPSETR